MMLTGDPDVPYETPLEAASRRAQERLMADPDLSAGLDFEPLLDEELRRDRTRPKRDLPPDQKSAWDERNEEADRQNRELNDRIFRRDCELGLALLQAHDELSAQLPSPRSDLHGDQLRAALRTIERVEQQTVTTRQFMFGIAGLAVTIISFAITNLFQVFDTAHAHAHAGHVVHIDATRDQHAIRLLEHTLRINLHHR